MNEQPWRLGAARLASAIAAGDVSCEEAVTSAIERLHGANPAVNAVTVELADEALAEARRADAARATGAACGVLHGVPVTIKENVDQAGQTTPNGVVAFRDLVAGEDAPVVANLRRAGAIVIGRTNTPEFSLRWFTDNPLRGRTLNPWHAGRTPGGSSGGAAAAVALGIGALAHGNDLGGSLRYPAYCCGVAAIKPSLGRVPAFNRSAAAERPPAIATMSVQGALAREVADLRLALTAMAVGDARDPLWVPAPLTGDPPATPARVALSRAPFGVPAEAPVCAALEAAARHLEAAGYVVEECDPPLGAEIAECWRTLLACEVRVMLEHAIVEYGSEAIVAGYRGFLADIPVLDIGAYMRLLAERGRYRRVYGEFLARYPLLLAPVSCALPFPPDEDQRGAARFAHLLAQQSPQYAINLLGLPAVAVPTGLVDGVPVGVQVVGARFREDLCLDAALAIERGAGTLFGALWARETSEPVTGLPAAAPAG